MYIDEEYTDIESDDIINNPLDPTGSEEYDDFDDGSDLGNMDYRGDVQVGKAGIGDSQWDRNVQLDSLHNLDAQRAELQPWTDQVGNAISQAVVGEIIGGTIEGLGYLLDVGSVIDLMSGQESEFGNFITDFGQSIREGTEENTRIYEDPNRPEGFFNSMGDTGWWFKNSVSVASTLSMLIPTMSATKGLSILGKGLSKGLGTIRKSADIAKNMGGKAKWMTEGISQAVMSRNIENWMEAHGTFEDKKQERLTQIDPETGEKFTEERAIKDASNAASENWKNGWAMLLQDIPQYLALGKVFNPITKKMESALGDAAKRGITANLKPWQQKLATSGGTFMSEGSEEAYQFMISERAKLRSDLKSGLIDDAEYDEKIKEAFGSEDLKTSAFFGGLGGNVFQVAGKGLNHVFKSKTRKEYEDNIGKIYDVQMKANVNQVSAMSQELHRADEDGKTETRKEIIDTYMLHMTAEALENDKYEAFIETIESMANMSEDDKANYKEISGGVEFDSELAKNYTPDILKSAKDMRKSYLKHRNKFTSDVSAHLSRLEVENSRWESKKSENAKNLNEIQESMGMAWKSQASDLTKSDWKRKEDTVVLERRIKDLKAQKAQSKSKQIKGFYDSVIKSKESKLAVQKKMNSKASEDRKSMSAQERETLENRKADDDLAKVAYEAVKDDIISTKEYEEAINDRISLNKAEMAYVRTPDGTAAFEKVKQKNHIENLTNEKDIEEAIVFVANNENFDDKEKKSMTESLNKRLKDIKLKKKENEARLAQEKEEAEADARLALKNEDPTVVDNQKKTTIDDSVEDENWNESIDVTTSVLNDHESTLKYNTEGSRSVPLLDKMKGISKYTAWMENTSSKIGEVFEYKVSPNIYSTNKKALELRKLFYASKAGGISQEIYDGLPIMAEHSTKPGVFTYIPQKPKYKKNPSPKDLLDLERYNNNYAYQRKVIIDRLKEGESTKTEIKFTSGGGLITDPSTEKGMAAENSLLDLQQVANDIDNIDIIFTDHDGLFMDSLKNPDSDFHGKIINVGKDSDKNLMAYRGGVFMKVRKADGKIFPLRLNLARNTVAQSEVLANILMDLAVPVLDENGVKKTLLEMDSYVSETSPELKEKIESVMGPELTLLGKDPSIEDLVNMFVYFSDKTKGKTSELYMKDGELFYNNKRITAESRDSSADISELVKFLNEGKRRQVSLKFLNEKNGYKRFLIENKIISTNATTDGAMFKNTSSHDYNTGETTGRRVQAYLAPLLPISIDRGNSNQTPQSKEIHARMDKTIKIGMNKNPDGVDKATYWYPNSSRRTREIDSMEEAIEKYQAELDAITDKVIPNDHGKGDDNVVAKAKKIVPPTPKVSDTRPGVVKNKDLSSPGVKKKKNRLGPLGKKTFNDNNTGAVSKKCQ